MTFICIDCGKRYDHLPADAECTTYNCGSEVVDAARCELCDGNGNIITGDVCDECFEGWVPC